MVACSTTRQSYDLPGIAAHDVPSRGVQIMRRLTLFGFGG